MSKNIETCKSEEVLSSVLDQQPQDYPSVQQAVHDLGVTALPAASAADPDIAELPSNVEVFVRRVLKAVVYDRVLPVVQQMWQAVLNRCSDYIPYSLYPYASNPSLRTLGTLPTALSALSPRKISNGGATNDGIKDGVSLAHLMNDTTIVTKLVDDNTGWTLTYNPVTKFANITLFKSNAQQIAFSVELTGNMFTGALLRELDMPLLERAENTLQSGYQVCYHGVFAFSELERVNLPKLNYINGCLFRSCTLPNEVTLPSLVTATRGLLDSVSGIKRISAPKLTTCNGYSYSPNLLGNCPDLEYAYVPNVTSLNWYGTTGAGGTLQNMPKLAELHIGKVAFTSNSWNTVFLTGCGALIKLFIYGDLNQNLYLNSWNPTDKGTAFLQNFLHHIAERLAVGPTTNRLTLTLSADVYSACGFGATIDDTTDIRYLIKKAIQDRNWKVTDGTNNFNQ